MCRIPAQKALAKILRMVNEVVRFRLVKNNAGGIEEYPKHEIHNAQ